MTHRNKFLLAAVSLLLMDLTVPTARAQQPPGPVKAVQLTGLTGVKNNAKGTLNVENGTLQFAYGKKRSDLSTSSIKDVTTGADTQKAVGGTIGVMSMAAPYGGGRFLSLFRKKIDTLTIQYRDTEGGLHGAIFTMPLGTADTMKAGLVAQGAATAPAAEPKQAAPPSGSTADKEEKAAVAQEKRPSKIKASAIQVDMIQSDEIKLPAEFKIALYENLIQQLEKAGKFQHIFRDGDRSAAGAADMVVLHSSVRGFKAGSERARQVTTVAGATSITVHCQFTGADSQSLLERDVNGKVRFFGGNLRATYDFAKKTAHITTENFSPSTDKR